MGEGKLASVLYQLHQDLRRRQRSMRKTYGTNWRVFVLRVKRKLLGILSGGNFAHDERAFERDYGNIIRPGPPRADEVLIAGDISTEDPYILAGVMDLITNDRNKAIVSANTTIIPMVEPSLTMSMKSLYEMKDDQWREIGRK